MDTTIFQKFYEEKTALINPTDCTKPIDNFPEVCISTFSKNIIDKFISLNSVQKIAELYTANGVNPVYKINYKGKEIAFYLSLVAFVTIALAVVPSLYRYHGLPGSDESA